MSKKIPSSKNNKDGTSQDNGKDAYIFPIYTSRTTANIEVADEMIVQSMVCKKQEIVTTIPLYFKGRRVEGNIYYWKPVLARSDPISQGLDLVEHGLSVKMNMVEGAKKKSTKKKPVQKKSK